MSAYVSSTAVQLALRRGQLNRHQVAAGRSQRKRKQQNSMQQSQLKEPRGIPELLSPVAGTDAASASEFNLFSELIPVRAPLLLDCGAI